MTLSICARNPYVPSGSAREGIDDSDSLSQMEDRQDDDSLQHAGRQLVDAHDDHRVRQLMVNVDGHETPPCLSPKSSGLLRRRRGDLQLSMEVPCVEKRASPLLLLKDRYKVLEKLGSGSACIVHRAVHLESGCHVALKIPRRIDSSHAAEKEYDLLKHLEPHPNIIKVFDFHKLQGEATLVLEFFNGVSLQHAVHEKSMQEATARTLCIALFEAVAHLHANQIIHRDIKPQNILISHCRQELRLIDFNVAACLEHDLALTPTGTPVYKAPELLLGEAACERSDVWSSGLCLFFMISASLPHVHDDVKFLGSDKEVADTGPLLGAKGWQHVSKECKDMLRACLAWDRENRPVMAILLDDAWLSHHRVRQLPGSPSVFPRQLNSQQPPTSACSRPTSTTNLDRFGSPCEQPSLITAR